MCPLISSFRIASACSAASSGVSANLTPPAFIRPPLSTCDLITTGPPISSATLRACSALVQKPYLVTGIPASSTILRASYSKNLMRRGTLSESDREGHPALLGYFRSGEPARWETDELAQVLGRPARAARGRGAGDRLRRNDHRQSEDRGTAGSKSLALAEREDLLRRLPVQSEGRKRCDLQLQREAAKR